jgi:hypothetical protein
MRDEEGKGRKMFELNVSFLISVYLRNTDLSPLQGGRVFKPVPRVKTLGESYCPFGAETEVLA